MAVNRIWEVLGDVRADRGRPVATEVKNPALVAEKRGRIVDAAVALFSRKGFHATTTREIARAAGISVGALYEYVASKEDVLYLVCEAIHGEMEERLRVELEDGAPPRERLERAMEAYIRVCDRMQDSILLVYRETASLDEESRGIVLDHEARISELFEGVLLSGLEAGTFRLKKGQAVALLAHTIGVVGHMWVLRRWFLRDRFTLEGYIKAQTAMVLREIADL